MANFYTVYNIKADVDSDLHSGGVSQLQNFYNTLDKARRAMVGKVRPPELVRKAYLEQALYPHVDRYATPEDLKYQDIIDLKKLSAYRNVDTMSQPLGLVYSRRFAQQRHGAKNVINVGYENGVKYVSVDRPVGEGKDYTHQLIHNCDSLTDNGTWNVGGNVVDLKEDKLDHVIGLGSLSFDINNSSTTGFIENFTMDSVDLEDFLQTGATFAWMKIPLPKAVVSVKLTLGSNTSNLLTDLYQSTVNQPHDNNEFVTGWNLLKFMMNNLSTVGTPNPKDIRYIRLDFTTTGINIPNCHIDNIVTRKGAVYEVTYNSPWIIMDSVTGVWKKFATSDNDIIVAEEDTYNLLRLETTNAAQKEVYGSAGAAKSDIADGTSEMKDAYKKYKMEHKSEALLVEDDMRVFGNQYDGLSSPVISDEWNHDGPWTT